LITERQFEFPRVATLENCTVSKPSTSKGKTIMTKITRKHIGTALCALLAGVAGAAHGATREKDLVTFNGTDGSTPQGALIADAKGNLYGTTSYGGGHCGNVFELSHTSGGWKETVLYNFTCGADGADPLDSLVFDAAGNLYGTAYLGGQGNGGVVFELTPSGGTWQYKVLFSFVQGQVKGIEPAGGLVIDQAGNLYGTTWAPGLQGGPHTLQGQSGHSPPTFWGCNDPGCGGTVFELSPIQGGGWQERDIYAFTGGSDGGVSQANLIIDAAGNLYGTTVYGGSTGCVSGYGCGVVFEVSPGKGGWSESVLHTFAGPGTDGANPQSSLIFGSDGNLNGTTAYGGSGDCTTPYEPDGCGTVFSLKPGKAGWKENVLHSFSGEPDGSFPFAAVTMDGNGNLLGTTYQGGNGCGVAYKLAPSGHSWSESVLYAFTYPNASQPAAPLLAMPDGRLFDTDLNGGTDEYGGVFELKSKSIADHNTRPMPHDPINPLQLCHGAARQPDGHPSRLAPHLLGLQ
jgi:uncharacterized repeat protein (TIGR03803 family)